MLLRIHVNQHNIRANNQGAKLPVISVKLADENIYANRVDILDRDGNIIATVVYRPNQPLPCGAKVWIETRNKVKVRGKTVPEI
ncbi:hypothetical protein [Nostoc sp. DedQUE07]|uniref:hypothetical protein n=1 Tax=Nostoc sp. DedQUE07 TaxID=3075392 RepID=UPI002AD4C4D3|nr:hypothetical protein [Nostoc sp. DedQUE07]MDZ8131938.1 hypothetical protein [Nostoc sp. DedQUE07]